MLFYSAADENKRREMLDLSVSVRAAFGADGREWAKYVGALKPRKTQGLKSISSEEKFKAFKETLRGG